MGSLMNDLRMRFVEFQISVLLFSAAVVCGHGQSSTAISTSAVSVLVTDQTGAVIPAAEVNFKNSSTVITRTTERDGSIIVTLPPGHYLVTVGARGFETARITDFTAQDRSMALRVALRVGASSSPIVFGASSSPIFPTEVPVQSARLPWQLLPQPQNADGELPAFSKGWTEPEKTRFIECVSRLSDRSRENTLQLTADSYACMIFEEQQHWMNLHPQALGKKENGGKLRKCFDKHTLQTKGTPEEFHDSFDLCMCRAYGLPTPKH
jgi:hypothetical protein